MARNYIKLYKYGTNYFFIIIVLVHRQSIIIKSFLQFSPKLANNNTSMVWCHVTLMSTGLKLRFEVEPCL